MVEEICTCKNDVIEQYEVHYSNKDLTQIRNTCHNEIRALIGMLIFSEAHKDNKISTEEMFSFTEVLCIVLQCLNVAFSSCYDLSDLMISIQGRDENILSNLHP